MSSSLEPPPAAAAASSSSPTSSSSKSSPSSSKLSAATVLSKVVLLWNVCIVNPWNSFFHERTTNMKAVVFVRRAYSIVCFFNVYMLSLDWYSFFRLVLPTEQARKTIDPHTWTIFQVGPIHDDYIHYFLYVWMIHLILLGMGIYPRINAFGAFFWITQFMTQNNQLWNGEDNVFRLCAFFMIFWPPYRHYNATNNNNNNSIKSKDDKKSDDDDNDNDDDDETGKNKNKNDNTTITAQDQPNSWPMWPFRLMQIQLCLIMFSSGGLKRAGTAWQNGTAMYRVVQHDALYGGYFNPDILFGYDRPLMVLTYMTQIIELGGILLIWFEETRVAMIVVFYAFHFGIDASMNLNCFHWIMMVGWSSFWIQPDDVTKRWSIKRIVRRILMVLKGGSLEDDENKEKKT